MKILLFSNTPANAEDYLKIENISGGWLKSIDKYLQLEVELNIVFNLKKKIKPFKYKKTNYFPIYIKNYPKLTIIFKKFGDKKKYINKYIQIINNIKPDIIHITGTENEYGEIVKYISNIPIVFSIQGNISVITHKFFSGIGREKIYGHIKFLTQFNPRSYLYLYNVFKKKSEFEKALLKDVKYVIGRTKWDERITKILSPNRNYYHNDEILRNEFYDNSWQNNLFMPIKIVTIMGKSLYKGLETIVEALNLLDEIKLNIRWEIIGVNENDKIVKIIKKYIYFDKEKITFLGKLTASRIVKRLLNSHIYVMASHIENSPNNLCEAMILGMPIIATNVGGTSSLFKDAEDGILIQDGDPWALAGSIIEVVENYQTAKVRAKHARGKAIQRHNPNNIVKELINIYNNIISDFKKNNIYN